MEFTDVIRSEEELRALMGDPVAASVVDKTLSRLDRHCLTFITRSPFVLVATSDGVGRIDISP
jgi:predicted pyridoxine 5'-phosphate oxidase superfamily flavin-nucleotide-binding protein